MARVLLAWELGGGLGHLTNYLPIAKGLVEEGHQLFAALRDLSRAEDVFAGIEVSFLQAPIRTRSVERRFRPIRTFAHILHSVGFGDFRELRALAEAWRHLYRYVRPDLIIFDHSPTALLAARGWDTKKAVMGTGFYCPVDEYPLRDLRGWARNDLEQLRRDEDLVLAHANRVLDSWGQMPLDRLSQLYHQVDENFLTTLKELDHYRDRENARYWGAWPNIGGKAPVWPKGSGKRIYAYLKPFPALPGLLALLNELRCSTLIYVDGINTKVQRRFQSATLRFENERLDLHQVGQECDLAILNGTHGTTAAMLLAGKPALHVPLYLEQALNGAAVARLGAGLSASPRRPEQIAVKLMNLLGSKKHAVAAREVAERYATVEQEHLIDQVMQRVADLLKQRFTRRT